MNEDNNQGLKTTAVRLLEEFKQAIQDGKLTVYSFDLEENASFTTFTVKAQRKVKPEPELETQ
jgi:hypothetical protein